MEELKAFESPTGPQLEVLGNLETKLPPPLKKRGTAWVLALVLVLVSVFALGGLKLQSRYQAVEKVYTPGIERETDAVAYNLQARQDAAANIITIGKGILGEAAPEVANAQAAVEELKTVRAGQGPSAQYAANSALGKAVDLLYQSLQADAALGDKAGTLQSQWSEFLSRQDKITHSAYNQTAQEYNQAASALPARLVATLWGCGEVELFA